MVSAGALTFSPGKIRHSDNLCDKFVRLIPFKDHINIEASGLAAHTDEFTGFKFTPKGMLQIGLKQEIDCNLLIRVFQETLEK